MNQATTVPKSLGSQYNATTATKGYGVRLLVVTYYIDNSVSATALNAADQRAISDTGRGKRRFT